MTKELGCGLAGHDDCRCDVIIDTPTEVHYGFDQVWGGDVARRGLGIDPMEGGARLATFLEALGSAYDATRRMYDPSDDDPSIGAKELRPLIGEQLQAGESIIDLPDILGRSMAAILAGVTGGNPALCWAWDDMEWLRWESRMADTDIVTARLAADFNLHPSSCKSMMELWGAKDAGSSKTASDKVAKAFVEANPELSSYEVATALADQGISYRADSVRRYRRRIAA